MSLEPPPYADLRNRYALTIGIGATIVACVCQVLFFIPLIPLAPISCVILTLISACLAGVISAGLSLLVETWDNQKVLIHGVCGVVVGCICGCCPVAIPVTVGVVCGFAALYPLEKLGQRRQKRRVAPRFERPPPNTSNNRTGSGFLIPHQQ